MNSAKRPEGFVALDSASPFNQHVGPYWAKQDGEALILGLRVEDQHCNTRGYLHGAMFCALADIALGHNIGLALGRAFGGESTSGKSQDRAGGDNKAGSPRAPIATVSLSTDFMGSARVGDWVEVHVTVERVSRSLAFAHAYLRKDADQIGRADGVFRVFLD